MITLTARLAQVYILLFVLVAGVSGSPIVELERRVVTGTVGRTLSRQAFRAARAPVRAATRPPPIRLSTAPRPAPQVPQQPVKGSSAGSTLAQSIFATKIATGVLVASGMHAATAADNKLAGEKREMLEDLTFERRTLTAAQQASRAALRTAARVVSRPVARPQVVARPLSKAAGPPPVPPKPPSAFLNNAKKVGKFTAMGLTGGVGEYYGGRTMSNMLDNLEKNEDHHVKRSIFDADEELFARTGPAVRAAARIGGQAMRAAARRGTTVKTSIPHSIPKTASGAPPPVEKKGISNTKLFSAIFAGAAVENGLQTMTPEAAEKIKHDPKGTITKMINGPVWGRPAGDKREFVDEEDVMARDASISELDEEILAREFLDMLMEDF